MALGGMGAMGATRRGGFGSGGALGRAGTSSAPTVTTALVSGTTFSFLLSPAPAAGDTIRLQVRASGAPDWSTLAYDSGAHTITQPEIDAGTITLTASGLAGGNYEASSIYHQATDSARSNVVSFTVTSSYVPTYYILGF